MCGIAGLLAPLADREARQVAARMGAALAHRGPDDAGLLVEPGVTLVHRRLAIQDLSPAGHQPMADASGRYVMVYNGEIYNHAELRTRFLSGLNFRGTSDSETLIELYARQGPDAFGLLNGIFALAIWDRKERTLTLARDGAGVKPLYVWTANDGRLAFASEIKALRVVPGFASDLDPVAAAAYAGFLWSPGERTMFAAVKKLGAGTWRRVSADGRDAGEGRFYALPEYAPEAMSDDAAIAGTADRLAAAVSRQMLADVEVGAFLSGGLDSSSIVHFAQRHTGRPLTCFTLAYDENVSEPGEMVADLPYARKAAAHLGAKLHEVRIDTAMAEDLPRLVEMLDEPEADPAALANYYISAHARDHGFKVLLGGAGGDDVFTGYRRHQQFARDRWIGAVPGVARAALPGLLALGGGGERVRKLRKAAQSMQGGADERLVRAFTWLPLQRAAGLLATPVDAAAVAAPLEAELAASRGAPAVERLLRLDQAFFLRDHNLNYTDKTGMAAAIEIRVPFLDPELMAWAARVPVSAKLRGGQTKWVLRKAMEPHLPHDVIYRPKTGFGVPLRAWMRGPLRALTEDLTGRSVVARRGLFDPAAVERLRTDHYAGRIDAAYPLLAVMMAELWCRRFVDTPEPATMPLAAE